MDDRQGWATNLKEEEVKERMKTKTFHVTKIHTRGLTRGPGVR